MKSIVIIIPYFGKLPPQFNFWLHSAYNNPSIDFIVITDNQLESYANVRIIRMSFEELCKHIQSKFDFPITIYSPYKLCDFKPAYGYIFDNYVADYDFWGWGDIDLVYGNIRHFITDKVLSDYKVISGWGHLTLYKNTAECNNFFKTKKENFLYYKEIFSNKEPKIFLFDEYLHGGLSDLWKELEPNSVWDERNFDDIIVPRLHLNFNSFEKEWMNHLIFEYTDKKLFRVYINENNEIIKEQTMYAHFQQRKFMKVQTTNYDSYLIIPNRFVDFKSFTINQLKQITKPRILIKNLRNFKLKIERRIKMIIDSINKTFNK